MKKRTKYVDKVYRLTRNEAPLSYLLPTRHTSRFPLLNFNEETGENRELRYARNQKSIYVDEQDGNAIVEPIIFEDGFLRVMKTNQVLQKFLDVHPLKGKRFEEVNYEKDAAKDVEALNSEVDALIEARSMTIEQMEETHRVLYSSNTDKITSAELKRDILVFAKTEPEEFLNIINDPIVKLQSQVQKFFNEGILMQKGSKVHFNTKSNKKRMLSVPNGEDVNLTVASYLQSDDGIEALKLLEKTLKN
tara:strand:+ start:20477 stop:21220 length:744 start_codon:yes stop_codon:yes gene_type:complete